DRQAVSVLVIGVVADQVDPAGRTRELDGVARVAECSAQRVEAGVLARRGHRASLGASPRVPRARARRYPGPGNGKRGDAVNRLQNSIDLAKSSWNVLREDKQLTVLPLLSGLSALVVALLFFGPVALIADSGTHGTAKPLAWILGAVGYLAITY